MAAVTNDYELGGLKQCRFILVTAPEARSLESVSVLPLDL